VKSKKILTAMGKISDDLIEDADIASNKKPQRSVWWKVVAIAACLCLLITGGSMIGNLFGVEENANFNPLVITVYAQSEDGSIVPTALKVGEKVKMYPKSSAQWEDFEGYAINLTLLEAKYVYLRAVDENWKSIRYPGDNYLYNFAEDVNWAMTEGSDIWVVHLDLDGKIIPPNGNELGSPKLKGSEIIWRPNNDGHNREIIGVFGEDYELLAVYFLEITEENGDYYAEVVKIDDEIPPHVE